MCNANQLPRQWRGLLGVAVFVVIPGCVSPPPPPEPHQAVAEQWMFDRMLGVADTKEEHEETVIVRHCTHAEQQSVTCEGAVGAVVSAASGVGIGASLTLSAAAAAIEGQIEAQTLREVGLSHQRSMGRQYLLEAPDAGKVRTYKVVYEFRVLKARAFVRSNRGNRRQLTHPLVVSCSIRAEPLKEEACAEGPAVTVASDAGGGVEGAVPVPEEVARTPQPAPTVDPNWEYAAVNAGTEVHVRLGDRVGTDVNRTEDPFEGTLAEDLKAGPVALRKRETTVRGRLALVLPPGRVRGKATLVLQLTAVRFGDLELPVVATETRMERSSKGKDWLRRGAGVVLGAAVGAAAGGARGAAYGAGGGLAAAEGVNAVDRGDHLVLNPGREVSFKLAEPLLVPIRRLR